MDSPAVVMERLGEIEADLANRQNRLETAAMEFFTRKRDQERELASAFLAAEGSVEERKHRARLALMEDLQYAQAQGRYEGLKAAVRVLETRATIGQSLLRAQSRDGTGFAPLRPVA
jgi:hypothetical protein